MILNFDDSNALNELLVKADEKFSLKIQTAVLDNSKHLKLV